MVRQIGFVVNFERSVVEALLSDYAPRIIDESLDCCWQEGTIDRPTFGHFQRGFLNAAARRDTRILVLAAIPEVAPGWNARERVEQIAGTKAVPFFHSDPAGTAWVREMLAGFFTPYKLSTPLLFSAEHSEKPFLCVEPVGGFPSLQGMIKGCFPDHLGSFEFRQLCPGAPPADLLVMPQNYRGLLYCRDASLAPLDRRHDVAYNGSVWAAASAEKVARKFVRNWQP